MFCLILGAAFAVTFVTVWHEAGHLLVARLLHIPIKNVCLGLGPTLWARQFGSDFVVTVRAVPAGMSIAVPARREDDGVERRPIGHDVLLAVGGPVSSFLLAGMLYSCAPALAAYPALPDWCLAIATLSALLALINLAPVPGLDGGHLVLLTIALLGWQLSPMGEQKLHRYGLQAVMGVAFVPLIVQVVSRFSA